jgi:POT family proton-dependent oligopeptide transporter
MLIATLVFWLARGQYVHVPRPPSNPDSFLRVSFSAIINGPLGLVSVRLGFGGVVGSLVLWQRGNLDIIVAICLGLFLLIVFFGIGTALQLDRVKGLHSDEAIDAVRGVLKLLVVFALVTPFWSLFDQKASTWVVQAGKMSKPSWFEPSMMQALNPALVMTLLPLLNFVVWPALKKRGIEFSSLTRITIGLVSAGVSWVIVGAMQSVIESGTTFSIVWQIIPYAFLTIGEVLVSATCLEFAYSQAPPSMKGAIMSFYNLSVTMGNLWVLLADIGVKNKTVTQAIERQGISTVGFLMFFFAGFAFLAALGFRLYARTYREVDHYRAAEA